MIIHYTINGSAEFPEGTTLDGRIITLPSGNTIKLWEAFELNDGEKDLTFDECAALGIHYDGGLAELEVFKR